LEGTLKIIWFQLPCHEQGHLPPDQAAQSSIQFLFLLSFHGGVAAPGIENSKVILPSTINLPALTCQRFHSQDLVWRLNKEPLQLIPVALLSKAPPAPLTTAPQGKGTLGHENWEDDVR